MQLLLVVKTTIVKRMPYHFYFLHQGLIALGFACVLTVLAAYAGCCLLYKANRNIAFTSEFLAPYSFLFGVAVIAWAMLVLACFGALNPVTLGTIVALQVLAVVLTRGRYFSVLYASSKQLLGAIYRQCDDSAGRLLLLTLHILLALILMSAVVIALVPTTETDSITSYLNAANLLWNHGGLIDVGHAVGNMAKQGFMPMIYGFALFSSTLTQVWLVAITIAGIVLMFAYFARNIGIISATIATLVLATMHQQLEFVFGTAKVDGMSLTFSILALVSWHDYVCRRGRVRLVLNAVAVGFLTGLSYMNLMAGAVFFVLVALAVAHSRGAYREKISALVLWGSIALLVAVPGYAYNWVTFGNPLYPYMTEIFGQGIGGPLLDSRGYFYGYIMGLYELGTPSIKAALSLPLVLWETPQALQSQAEKPFVICGALSCVGMVWLWLRPRANHPRWMTVGFIFAYAVLYGAWAAKQPLLRYFTVGYPLLFWFGAQMMEPIFDALKRCRLVSVGLVAIYMGLLQCSAVPAFCARNNYRPVAPVVFMCARNSMSVLIHTLSFEQFLGHRFWYTPTDGGKDSLAFGKAIGGLRGFLKPGDKVLSFIAGHYYLGDHVIVFSGNGSNTMPSKLGMPKPLYLYPDAASLMADLRANHFNYILIHPRFLYLTNDERPAIDGLLRIKPAAEFEGVRVIKVAP